MAFSIQYKLSISQEEYGLFIKFRDEVFPEFMWKLKKPKEADMYEHQKILSDLMILNPDVHRQYRQKIRIGYKEFPTLCKTDESKMNDISSYDYCGEPFILGDFHFLYNREKKPILIKFPEHKTFKKFAEEHNEFCFGVTLRNRDHAHIMPLIIKNSEAFLLEIVMGHEEYIHMQHFLGNYLASIGIKLKIHRTFLNEEYTLKKTKTNIAFCISVYLIFAKFINEKGYSWKSILETLQSQKRNMKIDIYRRVLTDKFWNH